MRPETAPESGQNYSVTQSLRGSDEWTGQRAKRGFDREKVAAEIARGGRLTRAEALRCRVRYLPRFARPSGCLGQAVSASLRICDGALSGKAEFVNRVFEENRWRFSDGRKSRAPRMRRADWGELRVPRDLREEVVRSG